MSSATFYTNSYNRLPLLRHLLASFELCNECPDVEWVITDYGSQDGSRDFLVEYSKHSSFPVKVILGDEREYFSKLQMPEIDRRTKFEAILRKFRNDAIRAASGNYIFDVGTDHQFIRKGNWVEEIDDIFRYQESSAGRDNLSGIIVYGYFLWRLRKQNNQVDSEQNLEKTPYFLAKEKAYVDYSVMKKKTLASIGEYLELTSIKQGTPDMNKWLEKSDDIRPESEFCIRCEAKNMRRAFIKYPFLATFKNTDVDLVAGKIKKLLPGKLLLPLWKLEEMKDCFGHLRRPVSTDELSIGHVQRYFRKIFSKARQNLSKGEFTGGKPKRMVK